MIPLDRPLTAGTALALGVLAHVVGWPLPRGGAQAISNALAAYLQSLGGQIVSGRRIRSVDELPPARAILCDLSPKPLLRIAGHRFPASYRRKLERYRYGSAVFKLDWALNAPISWKAAACSEAATVHLGGAMAEIALSEQQVWQGRPPENPFVLLAQPTLFDASRAPRGKHIAWAYCHVPNGSTYDMTERIEDQIERYAPGFRKLILARSVMPPREVERHNANYVGGDIASGVVDWRQFFTRPTHMLYSTPAEGIYICSAATPPGVGVHGMCGYFAARRALRRELRQRSENL
jgi:phytoene dehydrogenase-like protein